MKKNRMMRLASILLVCVLLTTSVISGTFAKYITSDEASDSARVAKWGVDVTASSNEVFTPTYAAEAAGVSGNSVVAATNADSTKDDVLAPGTDGTLGELSITGQPEVMVTIEVTADLTLTGWEIGGEVYCPIVFTVGSEEIKIDGTTIKTTAQLEAAVEEKFTALAEADVVAAGTAFNKAVSVDWAWEYYVDEATDVKDTALGNLTGSNVPTIEFEYEAIVTQVN